jgi:hypothetical protein
VLLFTAKLAHADSFDARGWTLLGTQEVAGRHDRDTFPVGKYEGKFDKLAIVVTDSDIELKGMTVFFANGDKWSPGGLSHVFKEGQRSRAIDLPGNDRQIVKIEMNYKNLPGGGKAKVSIYGRDTRAKPAGTKPDMTGWTLLGGQQVGGHRDHDTFNIPRYEGKFNELSINVLDSDLELNDFTVTFANGEKWSPHIKHTFKEGQRSRSIDLPGADRQIVKVDMTYANLPGGGKAYVELYGRTKVATTPPPPPNGNPGPMPPTLPHPPAFDPKGWTLLGTQTVNGGRDRDTIRIGKRMGGFDQLTLVVTDSDLDLQDMTIVFTGGEKWQPKLKHVFKEGQRSRAIDLPGKDRTISRVDLVYANLPGGGKARVELYGRDVGRPAPPPLTPVVWENKGWTFLGKKTVDGWRDRDRLNVSGAYTDLTFAVSGSDVQLNSIVVTFGNGEKYEMNNPVVFKEGTRTAPVNLPGAVRKVRSIEFAYQNLPGGGRASVEVWGKKAQPAPQPMPPAPNPPPTQQPPPPPPPPAGPTVRDHR